MQTAALPSPRRNLARSASETDMKEKTAKSQPGRLNCTKESSCPPSPVLSQPTKLRAPKARVSESPTHRNVATAVRPPLPRCNSARSVMLTPKNSQSTPTPSPRSAASTPSLATRNVVGSWSEGGLQTPPRRRPTATGRCVRNLQDSFDVKAAQQFEALHFHLDLPKHAKTVREQRDRGQYWGLNEIPAESVLALKESFRPCVDSNLLCGMFSNKMEEQLYALRGWQRLSQTEINTIVEMLDMVLKWLTLLLCSTNTKVLKLVLDVIMTVVYNLATARAQLTDYEMHILAVHIAERSGHNIAVFRETMVEILRQLPSICPQSKVCLILVQQLGSKNKRSVACVLRVLVDMLDHPAVNLLVRSSKDVLLVCRLLEEKDAEVRKFALQVMACVSQHVNDQYFRQTFPDMKSCTIRAIRSAACRFPLQMRSPDIINKSKTHIFASSCTPDVSPSEISTHASPSEISTLGDPLTPVSQLSEAGHASVHTPPHQTRLDLSICELIQQLPQSSGGGEFMVICDRLKEYLPQMTTFETGLLGEALLDAMRVHLGPTCYPERCWPLVGLLEELFASKAKVRLLPMEAKRSMLMELLRNLHHNRWTCRLNDDNALLQKINLTCVIFLNSLGRPVSYSTLLDLSMTEAPVVGISLVVKVLRKLNKHFWESKDAEWEVPATLDVVWQFVQKYSGKCCDSTDEGVILLLNAIREVVEAAQQTSEKAFLAWTVQHLEPESDQQTLTAEETQIIRFLLGM